MRTTHTRGKSGGRAQLGLYVGRIGKSVSTNATLMDSTRRGLAVYALELLERIAQSAALVAKRDKVQTIKSRHVKGAIGLVFGGELRRNAIKEGSRSCATFSNQIRS